MRIFVQVPGQNVVPIEAESFDTIDYVKGLIRDKEGICRLDYKLIFGGKVLEDAKTLRDYDIQNESTLLLCLHMRGGMHVRIKTSTEDPFPMGVSDSDTIKDVKAQIQERMGIPVNKQMLMFAGKQLGDARTIQENGIRIGSTLRLIRLPGDDGVDVAAVQARRRTARFMAKGAGSVLPNVGSKRAREDSSSTAPRRLVWGLSSCGGNCAEEVDSFWDEEDFGLAWKRSQSLIKLHDTNRFEFESDRTLVESVTNSCARIVNVMVVLQSRLQEYKERLGLAENEVKRLTEENACLKESSQKEKDKGEKLQEELNMERSTGTSFLQSERGRRHIVTLERQAGKSAVDFFKNSSVFNEVVRYRADCVYDDAVKECQRLLRKSGRVSEDIIQLLDSQDSDQEEVDDDDDDEEEEEEEDKDEDDEDENEKDEDEDDEDEDDEDE